MELKTAFSCGDKGWVFDYASGGIHQLTVGQVQVTFTKSEGVNDGRVEANCGIQFNNYKPKEAYEERYMCVETGVGSGSVYTLGESIFASEDECRAANAKRLREIAKEKREREEWERRQEEKEEAELRRRLARIEARRTTKEPQ